MFTAQYDNKKNRLMISNAGVELHSFLLKLPSKRWLQTARMFVVPLTRMNARMIHGTTFFSSLPDDAKNSITALVRGRESETPFPPWYTYKMPPMDHQVQAIQKCYPVMTSALYMDMGTGKTKVAIDMACGAFLEKKIPALIVICPLTVQNVWAIEVDKHATVPTHTTLVDSDFDHTKVPIKNGVLNILVVGVESLSQGRTFEKLIPWIKFHPSTAVFVDESSRIKNHSAVRTERAIELGRISPFKTIMSGTPVVKNLMDLFAQFQFLDPNIIGIGDYYAFRNRYAIMGGYKQKQVVGYDNVDELMGLIEPYTFRCTKDQALTLPPKLYTERIVELHGEQKRLYNQVRKGEMEDINVSNILTRILRLQQIAGGWVTNDEGKVVEVVPEKENPKLLALKELAEDDDKPMIVWARFLPEIRAITKLLSEYGNVEVMTGETKKDKRAEVMANFESGKSRFFVGTQGAGGIGITLIAARTVVYYSNTFSLEDRLQSEDRAHRKGQTNQVLYVDLLASKTVDMSPIRLALIEKKDLADFVSDKLKGKSNRGGLLNIIGEKA